MAIKIDPNQSATAYHINDGPVLFPYAIDAQSAVGRHPGEWRDTPWSQADADEARRVMADDHAKAVADAKSRGAPVPAPLQAAPPEPTPEEQAAITEHASAVAEAAARLKKFYAAEAEKKKIADQVAADEVLVATPPPRPDPLARRPLSPAQLRKQSATLTPAEQAEVDRKSATQTPQAPQGQGMLPRNDNTARAASPNPIFPVDTPGRTPQQIADEKAVHDKAQADRTFGTPTTG